MKLTKEDTKIRQLQCAFASIVSKSCKRPPLLSLEQIVHCFKSNYAGQIQQDAQEFLGEVLSTMDPKPDPWDQNPLSLLVSEIRNSRICHVCKTTYCVTEQTMMMPMDIPHEEEFDIQTVVRNFFEREELMEINPDPKYFCDKCKGPTQYTRKQNLSRLGPVCIVHLKLFDREGNKLSPKINIIDRVLFPCDGQNAAMSLTSVIVHKGDDVNSGHYLCYTRYRDGWLCLDDAKVTKLDLSQFDKSCTPYIFFYQSDDALLKDLDKQVYQLSKTFIPHLPNYTRFKLYLCRL
jgi:ubiquitin C-terminal hydrolase